MSLVVERRQLSREVYQRLRLHERRDRGRPTEYKPEYCEMLIEAADRGLTLMAFAGSIGKCYNTVYNWGEKYPDFAAAREIADAKFDAYWEERLRNIAETGKGNPVTVFFILKNRLPHYWRDVQRQEISGPDQGPVKIDLSSEDLRGMSDSMLQLLEATLKKIVNGRDIKLEGPQQRSVIEGSYRQVPEAAYEDTLS